MTTRTARRLMQVRDIFAMRSHAGWLHFLLHRSKAMPKALATRFARYTDSRSAAFDEQHGTDTFARKWVSVRSGVPSDTLGFGYGPVNQDFFREILHAVRVPLAGYTLVDVGAGKGAAVMVASEFNFKRHLAVELNADLIRVGQDNLARYRASTGRAFHPEWVQADFFTWQLPDEDCLLFLNNPFPPDMSLDAIRWIEQSLQQRPRRMLLVYRKAPKNVGDHLHASPLWKPLRLAPYWRIYASQTLAHELKLGK